MRQRLSPSGLLASLLSATLCLGSAATTLTAAAVAFDVQVYDRTENRYLPTMNSRAGPMSSASRVMSTH
jgi:hypothetical protein